MQGSKKSDGARVYVRHVEEEDCPSLTTEEALARLERFLDRSLDIIERCLPLDDVRIADAVVIQFLHTIPVSFRLQALMLCERAAVHEAWAGSRLVEEREAIASNFYISPELQMQLAHDSEEPVRAALPNNYHLDFEVLTVLLADSSVYVQEALVCHFECRKNEEPIDEWDYEPGSDESLTYLTEMVPAVEAEECLEDWENYKHNREITDLIRETQHADWPALEGDPGDDEDDEAEPDASAASDEEWHLTPHQVFALLQMELGAKPVRRPDVLS
jgi:hypothetical protein